MNLYPCPDLHHYSSILIQVVQPTDIICNMISITMESILQVHFMEAVSLLYNFIWYKLNPGDELYHEIFALNPEI